MGQRDSTSTADMNRDEAAQSFQQVTIERTSKQYKFGMVIGFLMVALGVGTSLLAVHEFMQNYERFPNSFGELEDDRKAIYVSLSGIVPGLIVFYFENFLAWWNNG